ncbi:uncharacterized protein LOC135561547 [Oncorhynchus nerka]|uniref:uncharacterized protein LOC135561547 n=1 Tax=Oncorhynchus nerka TaxID=8023 RepID=UPI0031B85B52
MGVACGSRNTISVYEPFTQRPGRALHPGLHLSHCVTLSFNHIITIDSVHLFSEEMNFTEVNSSSLNLSHTVDLNFYWEYCKDLTSVFLACELTALALAFPIHGYTLWLITGSASIATEIFIFNMAVLEIGYSLLIPLADAVYLLTTYQSHFRVIAYTASLLLFSRPVFQCCICVERYLAVVHPVVFLKYKPLRYRVGWAAGAWGVTLMFTGTGVSLYTPQFPIHCFLTYTLLFLFVDLFCSLSILRVLKRPKLGQGEMERRGGGEKEKEGMNTMKKRAFMIVSVVMTTMLINNILTVVIYLLCDFIAAKVFCLLDAFNMLLLVLCGLVQPLFYLHRSRKLPCCLRGQ